MSTMKVLSEDIVPKQYQEDSMPELNVDYLIGLYSKFPADEKDICQVFLGAKVGDNRIGWIVPLLSLLSTEHGYENNKYFRKHAYEAFRFLKNKELPENTYILVASKRILEKLTGDDELGSFGLSFAEFGVYPYFDKASEYENKLSNEIGSEISVSKGFDYELSRGYIKLLAQSIIQTERNSYARFMFLYQVFELAMEMVFYSYIDKFKKGKSHLGIIREKISELSSERKLIKILYSMGGIDEYDVSLADKAKEIFGGYKDDSYYKGTYKSDMIYELRNTIVHSYHRYDIDEKLAYLCNYLEMEAYKILDYIFREKELHDRFLVDHFVEVKN